MNSSVLLNSTVLLQYPNGIQ